MKIIDSKELHPVVIDKFQFLSVPLNVKADFSLGRHYLYHNENEFVSTDGHRLHIVKDENLPVFDQGFYKIIKKNKSSFMFIKEEVNPKEDNLLTFPDYKLVMPKEKAEVKEASTFIPALTYIIRNVPENETINPDYIKDLYPQEYQSWKLSIHDRKVMFEDEDKLAIVMGWLLENDRI